MKKKVLILLLVLVALGAWWKFRVKSTDDGKHLVLHGNVDIREVSLGFRVAGRLAAVLHDEGDLVKTGDILARLDEEPFRHALDEAQGQVDALKARLKLLETGYRPEEIAQARASVNEREVTAANAKRLFDRQQELFATKAVSIQERDDSEARYREADARLKLAQQALALLEAGFRSEEITQAKGSLLQAESALQGAQLRLEDTTLKSPSDGVILTRAQEPGAILPIGATVLTVSLKEPVWIRAYVSEPNLGRIHQGAKVEIRTDSRPNQPYAGTIGFISPRAEFTPKSVETSELRTSLVYRLRVVVTNADDGLLQGMPVTATVLSE